MRQDITLFMLKLLGGVQSLITFFVLGLIGLVLLANHSKAPSAEKIKLYQSMVDDSTRVVAVIQRSADFEINGTINYHSYTHRYRFSIDSIYYEGMFTSKNSYAGRDSIWIYYNKLDPAINTRNPWSVIEEENGKRSSPKKFVFASILLIIAACGSIFSLYQLIRR